MADWADARGVTLRPHVKTHKSLELARRQLAHGASGITVATVGEAEVFADGGFRDVFIAYPLWIDDALAHRIDALSQGCRVILGVDSVESAAHSVSLLRRPIEWRIELNSGHRRSGAAPEDAQRIAEVLLDAGHRIDGAFTFPGHSYSPDGRATAAAQEATALAVARDALEAIGVSEPTLSGGSTPSMAFADASVATEFRPGVYLFGDAQQWELGSHSPERIALWAEATVVSATPGRYVTNAGSKLLGADRAGYATGYGRLLDDESARIVMLSEHHSVVESSQVVALGDRVRIVPNHVCNAVNLVDELHGTDGTVITVDARGRNA